MHFSDNNSVQNGNTQHSCSLYEQNCNLREQARNINTCNSCKQNNYVNTSRATWGLESFPLASVYAPLQEFDNIYDCETSLVRGTIFKELDLPFRGCSVARGGGTRE